MGTSPSGYRGGEQPNIPATAIPYSVDELKAMLAVKEHEQEKMRGF